MIWRIVLAVILVLCLSAPAAAASSTKIAYPEIQHLILRQAQETGVPPSLAMAVAHVESGFNPTAVSAAGAVGVMQIMPQTGEGEFGVEEAALYDPRINIRIGVEFLRQLYLRYDRRWDLALSHYNGGTLKPGPEWHPHDYTLRYIARVMDWKKVYDFQQQLWAGLPEQQISEGGEGASVFDIPAPVSAITDTVLPDDRWPSDKDFIGRLRLAQRTLDDFPVTEPVRVVDVSD
tara:strand:- start:2531 stop:3229 length:699 start_codon:yes stop_codon:yes gene_type:complete